MRSEEAGQVAGTRTGGTDRKGDGVVLEAGPGLRFGYEPGRPVLGGRPRGGAEVELEGGAEGGVHVQVRAGSLTVLLGPNGSGKSTLLRLLLGQLRPDAGAVSLGGRDLRKWPARELARRVAYVPQRGSVSLGFSVAEVVAMGRFAFGDRAYVDEALERMELTDLADRPVRELSGGQQQRVMLARAWAQSRGVMTAGGREVIDEAGRVVLADEPAAHLDLRHVQATMAMLRELADEGKAVLVVLHDLTLAQRWADEVVLLAGGRVVAQGGPEAVLVGRVLEPVYGVSLREVSVEGQRHLVVDGRRGG